MDRRVRRENGWGGKMSGVGCKCCREGIDGREWTREWERENGQCKKVNGVLRMFFGEEIVKGQGHRGQNPFSCFRTVTTVWR